MDDLIEQYREELDRDKRIALAHQLEQRLYETGVMIPTFKVPYTREAYWAWVKLPEFYATKTSTTVFDPLGISAFWIDTEEKSRIRSAKKAGEALPAIEILDETWKSD